MSEVVLLLDELSELESSRCLRLLSRPERQRWQELQRRLSRALCDFAIDTEERRTSARLPCPLEVLVASDEARFEATATDLSAGGIGIRAGLLPTLGERVLLVEARHGAERLELGLSGHVVWLRKLHHVLGAGFGIAFDGESELQRQRLAQLLLVMMRQERARR